MKEKQTTPPIVDLCVVATKKTGVFFIHTFSAFVIYSEFEMRNSKISTKQPTRKRGTATR